MRDGHTSSLVEVGVGVLFFTDTVLEVIFYLALLSDRITHIQFRSEIISIIQILFTSSLVYHLKLMFISRKLSILSQSGDLLLLDLNSLRELLHSVSQLQVAFLGYF